MEPVEKKRQRTATSGATTPCSSSPLLVIVDLVSPPQNPTDSSPDSPLVDLTVADGQEDLRAQLAAAQNEIARLAERAESEELLRRNCQTRLLRRRTRDRAEADAAAPALVPRLELTTVVQRLAALEQLVTGLVPDRGAGNGAGRGAGVGRGAGAGRGTGRTAGCAAGGHGARGGGGGGDGGGGGGVGVHRCQRGCAQRSPASFTVCFCGLALACFPGRDNIPYHKCGTGRCSFYRRCLRTG